MNRLIAAILITTCLSGCSLQIKQDFTPTIEPSLLLLPDPYQESDLQLALGQCLIERKVMYLDIKRIQRTAERLDRRWWQVWK